MSDNLETTLKNQPPALPLSSLSVFFSKHYEKTHIRIGLKALAVLSWVTVCAAGRSPTARVITLSFSRTTFTTLLFCSGVTLQQSTERQCLTSSMKRSCRSGESAMLTVRPSMISEMFWVVPTLRGSASYLLTSSSVQSRMDVHVSWGDTPHYFTAKLPLKHNNCTKVTDKSKKKNVCHVFSLYQRFERNPDPLYLLYILRKIILNVSLVFTPFFCPLCLLKC